MIGLIEAVVVLQPMPHHGRHAPRERELIGRIERTDWLIDEVVCKLHGLKEGGSAWWGRVWNLFISIRSGQPLILQPMEHHGRHLLRRFDRQQVAYAIQFCKRCLGLERLP